MKNISLFIVGLLIGGIVIFFVTRNNKPEEYFIESTSKYKFEETVAQFEALVAETEGWKILKTYDLQKSMEKSGYNVQPVKAFSLCNPDYSSKILFSNQERVVSSMMPCRVSIYVRTNGKTYISRMNSAAMASDMGGLVDDVIGKASADIEEIIDDLIIK
ncbi:MAG: DUF302 domain-containing protein [Prolixibacteraceae bacterium]|jgi:uncharacterized protein (DUF302 family)|nr:DUF302 domain-containing protein [Prolixibacteraceae bacterium]